MSMIYEGFSVEEETPVQYVGVYVTKWRPEWGQPTMMFRDASNVYQAAPEMLEALRQILVVAHTNNNRQIWAIAKVAIDGARGV